MAAMPTRVSVLRENRSSGLITTTTPKTESPTFDRMAPSPARGNTCLTTCSKAYTEPLIASSFTCVANGVAAVVAAATRAIGLAPRAKAGKLPMVTIATTATIPNRYFESLRIGFHLRRSPCYWRRLLLVVDVDQAGENTLPA